MLAKLIQDRQKSKILNRKREKNLSERIYPLDTLKFTAAILIVFHHFQQSTGACFSGINFYGGKFYFGNLVELFFILSGICARIIAANIIAQPKPSLTDRLCPSMTHPASTEMLDSRLRIRDAIAGFIFFCPII